MLLPNQTILDALHLCTLIFHYATNILSTCSGVRNCYNCDLPLVVAAGAGAVHPAVLLVAVLVDALPAVVEGRLHTAHAGEGVQGGLCRAEAGVVAQPSTWKSTRGCTGCATTSATAHTDDRLGGGGGGRGGGGDGGGGGGLLWFSAGVWRLRDHSGVGRRLRD